MTTAGPSLSNPGTPRLRTLDALFESVAPPAGVGHGFDADLASQLDDEVLVAETGRSPALSAPHDMLNSLPQPLPAWSERSQRPDALGAPPSAHRTPDDPTSLPALADRSEERKDVVISRLDCMLEQGWQRAFHRQIDALYKQVATEFSSPPAVAERALTLLREARQLMVHSPEEYVSAEYRIMQVRAMLERTVLSRKDSAQYGPRILAYEVGWLLLLLLGLVFAAPRPQWIVTISSIGGQALLSTDLIVNTMFWSGAGGVAGALCALWWHISEKQDFDRHSLTWYLVQPLTGLVLGGIVFLILTGVFVLLRVDLSGDRTSIGARLFLSLAAVLAGVGQNFVYKQPGRLMALLTSQTRGGSAREDPASKAG